MKLPHLFIGVWAVALTANPLFAQTKGKNITKAVDAALSRQTAQQVLANQAPVYHPVFGYRPFTAADIEKYQLATIYGPKAPVWHSLQVAPILHPAAFYKKLAGFARVDALRPGQVVQAVYLWRLANPQALLSRQFPALFDKAQNLINQAEAYAAQSDIPCLAEDYPPVKLLPYLLNEKLQPLSYAQLLANISVYPKHIELNEDNFPVFTPQAQLATQLDAYLMLSNPQEMGSFNNVNEWQEYKSSYRESYYKFVLTPEEKQAANALVALRQQAYQIPQHPTSRELLELMYNELESHAFTYSQLTQGSIVYEAYPNYKNTPLFLAVKQQLGKLQAKGLMQGDLEFADYVHLLVLNAVMGGVELGNHHRLNEVLWAFKQLCGITKNTEFNIQHLYHLQQGLRSVAGLWSFADMPFVMTDLQARYPYAPVENLEELRWWTHQLLEQEGIRNLVGKSLK